MSISLGGLRSRVYISINDHHGRNNQQVGFRYMAHHSRQYNHTDAKTGWKYDGERDEGKLGRKTTKRDNTSTWTAVIESGFGPRQLALYSGSDG